MTVSFNGYFRGFINPSVCFLLTECAAVIRWCFIGCCRSVILMTAKFIFQTVYKCVQFVFHGCISISDTIACFRYRTYLHSLFHDSMQQYTPRTAVHPFRISLQIQVLKQRVDSRRVGLVLCVRR